MKVSIITRHAINNYGSLLQAYATQTAVERLGYEAEIIDYVRKDEEYRNIVKTQLFLNKKWNRNFLTRGIYLLLQEPEYIESGRKFEKMQRQYLKLSRRYTTNEELTAFPPAADIYCTGSDQVWGPIGKDFCDPAYFLNFVPSSKRKISYAASFGRTQFNQSTLPLYQQLLQSYNSIAVRENSALDILEQIGITSGEQVLDPTLLISNEEWKELLGDMCLEKEPYILLYYLGNNPDIDTFARVVAKRRKMPLIRISAMRHWKTKGARNILLPDLGKFVSYIRHATYLITNSFHGTAFAINCGTQFVNILPGVTATRNTSILSQVRLENRIVNDYTNDSILDKRIDFSAVHEILTSERKKSAACLTKMLKEESLL